jgi:hypothetical protein
MNPMMESIIQRDREAALESIAPSLQNICSTNSGTFCDS